MKSALPLSALIALAACSLTAFLQAGTLLTEDFENIDGPAGKIPFFYKEEPIPGSISVVSDRARSGKKSLKFEFDSADWKKNEPKRAEIYDVKSWGPDGMPLRKDWWFGFSQYIPQDWQVDEPNNPEIIWQFHGWEGGPASANPPLSAVVFGDKLYIRLAQGVEPAERAASFLDLAIMPLPVGVWTDVVLNVNFDYKLGHVVMWRDGKKIVDYQGPTLYPMIGQTNEKGPGFKTGIYKWDWGNLPSKAKHRTLYLDEIRFGDSNSSFEEVTPR